jgi:hypothetical protein
VLTIPTEVETLLKSRSMLGANRPQWNVVLTSSCSSFGVPDVSEIVIEKQMYQAQVCQLTMDNKDGVYSPDRTGAWSNLFWPNSEIKVELGYGSTYANAQAFLGLIDSVQMRRLPHVGSVMNVTCRDYYKRALDQMVQDDLGTLAVTYSDQALEDVFVDLAERAGWSTGDITAEPTCMVVAEKTFARESYADAFLWLSEVAGFEVVVPETGTIEYRFATDRQPEAVAEPITLTSTAWTNLAHNYVVSGSMLLRSSSAGGGDLYSTDSDYDIEYGDPARVARLAGSSIGDGSTCFGTYVYAAWTFTEGVDIFELGYTIDDDDMYADVVVEGESETGEPIYVSRDTYLNPYWNLHDHKTMYVRLVDADSSDKCDEVASRLATRSAQRARRCEFATVGNPWLQVGDCIQIVEHITTVSEIYRITGIEHRFDKDGFVTQLQTHYYGYTAAPG